MLGMTVDEMAGWHHRLNGYGFGWTPGVSDGQGGLACCSSWGCKESDPTEWLNWNWNTCPKHYAMILPSSKATLWNLVGYIKESENVCLNNVRLFVTPWTVAHLAPLSIEFSRQEYWSGLPFLSPVHVPHPGIEPGSLAMQTDSLLSEPPRKIIYIHTYIYMFRLLHNYTHLTC